MKPFFQITSTSSTNSATPSTEEEEEELSEELPPLEDFHPPSTGECWKLLLRLPLKKKLTQNRHWKQVFVKLAIQNNVPTIRVCRRYSWIRLLHLHQTSAPCAKAYIVFVLYLFPISMKLYVYVRLKKKKS